MQNKGSMLPGALLPSDQRQRFEIRPNSTIDLADGKFLLSFQISTADI